MTSQTECAINFSTGFGTPPAEYAAGAGVGSPTREYIYSGSQLLATIEGSATKYHHSDHLSLRVTTDTNGVKIADSGHYPYGENSYETGGANKLKFTSYARDNGTGESGNDYAIFRYNVNRLGRFSRPDPITGRIGDPQSLNRYAYVGNDPIDLIDPSGLTPLDPLFESRLANDFPYQQHDSVTVSASAPEEYFPVTEPLPQLLAGHMSGGYRGGDAQQSQARQPQKLSKDCLDALAVAGQNARAVYRAEAAADIIKQAATDNEIDPNILAAIGVRETGFRDIPEQGGGGGRGVFQIDITYHPNAAGFASDLDRAADYAASLLGTSMDFYQQQGFSDELSSAAAVRDYNASPGRGHRRTLGYLRTGNINALDRRTTGGNYVSNVLAIARNCFHF